MQIKCRLFAGLRAKVGAKEVDLSFNDTTRVRDVLQSLRLDGRERYIVLRNGIHAELEESLNDGDVLSIFPMIAGG